MTGLVATLVGRPLRRRATRLTDSTNTSPKCTGRSGGRGAFPGSFIVLKLNAARCDLNFDRRLYDILLHLGVRDSFEQVVISSQVGAQKPALASSWNGSAV